MKSLFTFLLTSLIALPGFAYLTATGTAQPINPYSKTHLIVIGLGGQGRDGLGFSLAEAAAAQVKKYREMFPDDQVYILGANESDSETNLLQYTEYGFKNFVEKGSGFDADDLFSEMSALKNIASFDVFSHSTSYYGVMLNGKFNRFDPKNDKRFQGLKGNFSKDAYVFFHGCNSGFLAGFLSMTWGIPAAGSFTGSDFQYLYDNNTYQNDDVRAPVGSKKVKVNKISFGIDKGIGCYSGACSRLMPDNFAYHGYWGSFEEGGLGFYKWFCFKPSEKAKLENPGLTEIPEINCKKTMARAALSYVSVKSLRDGYTLENYKDVVLDYLCPATKYQECRTHLESAIATGKMEYDPFTNKSLQCDLRGCKATFGCETTAIGDVAQSDSCYIKNLRTSPKTTTLANEYKAYLEGFNLLKQDLYIKR